MSRKMFTIYVSVYNTQPLLQLKYAREKCGLYTVKDGNEYSQEGSISGKVFGSERVNRRQRKHTRP